MAAFQITVPEFSPETPTEDVLLITWKARLQILSESLRQPATNAHFPSSSSVQIAASAKMPLLLCSGFWGGKRFPSLH